MAFCTHCGTQMSEIATACPQCGHPASQVTPVIARPAQKSEPMAVASLACGIAGLVVCPLIPSIVAVILAAQARQRIAADPSLEGAGMAKAGMILGWVGIGLGVLGVLLLIAFFAAVIPGNVDGEFMDAMGIR